MCCEYGQQVMGMLDCAPLIIVSDDHLIIQSPVAQWLRHLFRKPQVLGSISAFLPLPTVKQYSQDKVLWLNG